MLIAFTTLYFNFIKPAKIKILVSNKCKLYYSDFGNNNDYGVGFYLPIDFVNISNKTGIIVNTAIVFHNKNHTTERFLIQQKEFAKLDTEQKQWTFDEVAHSIVVPPKTSVNKTIWYYWYHFSTPKIELKKGEYDIKIYYWLNHDKKPKLFKCKIYIDDNIETILNKNLKNHSSNTVDITIDKEFDDNKCITEKEEDKILK